MWLHQAREHICDRYAHEGFLVMNELKYIEVWIDLLFEFAAVVLRVQYRLEAKLCLCVCELLIASGLALLRLGCRLMLRE